MSPRRGTSASPRRDARGEPALRGDVVRLVAGREIRTRVASKSFRLGTAALVLAAVLAVVALRLLSGSGDRTPTFQVGVTGPATNAGPILEALAADAATLEIVELADAGAAAALEADRIDVAFDGDTVTSEREPDPLLLAIVDRAAQVLRLEALADAEGLDPDTVLGAALGSVTVDVADEPDDSDDVRVAVASIATVALFLLIQIFGAQVASSVVEEKSTRVVEVLLAHVRPRELLAGKVAGVAVLAAIEMTVVATGIFTALATANDVTVPSEVWGSVGIMLAVFSVGFVFYAVLFAAAGSLVSRQEDVQQVLLPVVAPLLVGYMVGLTPGAAASPVGVALGYVPLTSPALLPSRFAAGDMALWQVGVAIGVLVVACVLGLRVAAAVYERSLLRTGARVRIREVLRRPAGEHPAEGVTPR